jgi:hypothetical protein
VDRDESRRVTILKSKPTTTPCHTLADGADGPCHDKGKGEERRQEQRVDEVIEVTPPCRAAPVLYGFDLEAALSPELRNLMTGFGLKPKAKKRMREKLTEVFDYINNHPDSEMTTSTTTTTTTTCTSVTTTTTTVSKKSSKGSRHGQTEERRSEQAKEKVKEKTKEKTKEKAKTKEKPKKLSEEDIEALVRSFLFHHDELYMQIVTYQTLQLVELQTLLEAAGIKVGRPALMGFLDRAGIIFSQGGGKPNSGARVAKPRGRPQAGNHRRPPRHG